MIFKFFKPANKDSSVVIFLGDEAFNGFVFSGIEAQFPPVIVDGSPQAERGKKIMIRHFWWQLKFLN